MVDSYGNDGVGVYFLKKVIERDFVMTKIAYKPNQRAAERFNVASGLYELDPANMRGSLEKVLGKKNVDDFVPAHTGFERGKTEIDLEASTERWGTTFESIGTIYKIK